LLLIPLFFFSHTSSTTLTYTLSLHDALPICFYPSRSAIIDFSLEQEGKVIRDGVIQPTELPAVERLLRDKIFSAVPYSKFTNEIDRKSTRLNSSHVAISYAVFCLKKKKKQYT